MNSLERIMAAVNGLETDRQPFTLLLSLYGASLIKCDIVEYYRDASLWFEGQEAVVETFDPDILITPFSFPLEAEAFGSEVLFLPHYAPNIRKPIINNLSQINKLELPDIASNKSIQYFTKATGLLSSTYKASHAIASPIHSPTDLPSLLMGIEMWIDTLLFNPKEVHNILEKTVEHFVRLGNEYLALGATFLIVPVNFTNPMIITEKIFMQLMPYLEWAFSQLKGPVVIHNGGCKILPFLKHYQSLPNVVAVVIEPHEKFEDARDIIGDKMVLMGNLDGPRISMLNPEQAAALCLKKLNDRKDDSHYIFASSNADIPYDTPVSTIKAIVSTIKAFKK